MVAFKIRVDGSSIGSKVKQLYFCSDQILVRLMSRLRSLILVLATLVQILVRLYHLTDPVIWVAF